MEKNSSPISFTERLTAGQIIDIDQAAQLTGYSPQHLRRLCAEKKINHFRRGNAQYFFRPEDVEKIFEYITVKTEKKNGASVK